MSEPTRFAPHPWDWLGSGKPGSNGIYNVYITDLDGRKIAAVWGKEANEEKVWTASLMAEAPALYQFAQREAAKGNAEAQRMIDEIARMVSGASEQAA
jgi:hypothetical protein